MPRLVGTIRIHAPIERCFDLTRSVDFHAAAARSIKGQAVGGRTRGLSEEGDSTRWQATFFGLGFRLTTRIEDYARPSGFADVMTKGPFHRFFHVYRFTREADDQTLLEDTFVSWQHEDDFCRATEFLLHREDAAGIYNLCAPNPLTNRDMMAVLRETLGIPLGLPASRWMLETGAFLMRTETELIVKSRRVVPARLLEEGFTFNHEHLESALADIEERLAAPG